MEGMEYLQNEEAKRIDADLMSAEGGYALEQLMELAGLACAYAIHDFASRFVVRSTNSPPSLGPKSGDHRSRDSETTSIIIVAGPGGNGGDGLVAARHLALLYGNLNRNSNGKSNGKEVDETRGKKYDISVVFACKSGKEKDWYLRLQRSLRQFQIPAYNDLADHPLLSTASRTEQPLSLDHCVIVDALFGFGFKPRTAVSVGASAPSSQPPANQPSQASSVDGIVRYMNELRKEGALIFAIDVPSNWGPEAGGEDLKIQGLVSLMWPKSVAARIEKNVVHYLGGRFLPTSFEMKLPGSPNLSKIYENYGIPSTGKLIACLQAPSTASSQAS